MTMHVWLLSFMLAAAPKAKPPADPLPEWPGEKMPLPLAVQTPEEPAFKAMAEKQYLEFNLLASGKVACSTTSSPSRSRTTSTWGSTSPARPARKSSIRRDR
jgi:hypothetical protein